ncbi:MAG TPA: urease accessory UreF family protein [Marmoricola sp.]|nr:urease accessory UreF family protein [Marmoricola sp.]
MAAAAGSPEIVAMMLADARLPTGGHTQSGGLEPAVRAGLGDEGRKLEEIGAYARDRLRTVVRVEAGTAVVARHLALTGADPLDVVPHWAARTPSRALRDASRRQGRGYIRLAARVWPEVLRHLPADTELPRPLVVGVVGAVTGLGAAGTARLIGYDDAQTVVAASLKLLPIDPGDAAVWLAGLHRDIEDLAQHVQDLVTPDTIPADAAPGIDLFAEQHSYERMRLFHA